MIIITVNGKQEALESPTTVAAYIEAMPIEQRHLALALNGEVIPRDRWPNTPINEGDAMEIVRMVGGGSTRCRPRSK
jgi:sulfur carrier protein